MKCFFNSFNIIGVAFSFYFLFAFISFPSYLATLLSGIEGGW